MSQELIAKVADLLGWHKCEYGLAAYEPNENTSIHYNDLITVAAYAEAEMALRDKICINDYDQEEGWFIGVGHIDDHTKIGCGHPYSPSDPISEATAILSAVIEALEGGE